MSGDLLSTMRSISKAISDSIHPFLELQAKLAVSFEPLYESVNKTVESIQEISRQVQAFYSRIADVVEKLPEGTRRALELLGQRGWYISLHMPMTALYKQANQIQLGNYSEVDEWMNDFYERNLDRIKEDLQERFPHRSAILERAFEAHKRSEYELSIPVFLSQADGICHELTGIQLYSRREGQPRTAGLVEQLTINSLSAAMMEPLRVPLPISASSHDREELDYPSESLNRHQILHGEVVDYATQTNGCKAISLLHYVAIILDREFFEEEN